ncbi:Hypp8324 [Branchiostoma lanceolatum]|uniref:Hypp8324 protein n=1 Tax=Branchiostoma lanceolatum TaxID=7740 RepID=A0A8J9Z7L5_BRALA|nr:Hypp8324 [Branchiostoma lanceolatum]
MDDLREFTSGGASAIQFQDELKAVPKARLLETFQELGLDQIRIPNGHLLAAKVDCGFNYNQIRKLRRWLKKYGVAVESEKVSRQVAKGLLSNITINAECLPFTVKTPNGTKVELLPCAYLESLTTAIFDNLSRSASSGKLTWHKDSIWEEEVWVKILGDHGGGSFKMAFQPLNKLHPNSKSNTIVCSVFEAKDNRENVTTGTKRYAEEIKELQVTKWKSPDDTSYSIRVFASSDYALLSLWYGISGACGVHPCLWCEETKTGIRQPKSERQTCSKRTLDSLYSDHKRFLEQGQGNIKKAKNFKNVIAPPMFDIPLNQVCVPGLHISLGLFHKFFKLLEAELQDLDIILANHLTTHILLDEEVDAAEVMMDPTLHGLTKYVEAADQARILEAEAAALTEEIESCENDLTWIFYQEEDDFDEDEEDDVPIALLQQNAVELEEDIKCFLEKKDKLLRKAQDIRSANKITVAEGPLSKQLDMVLKKHNVKRQAYHSQSFIGNHVQAMLKDKPIEDMTTIIVAIVNELVDSYDFPLGMRERAKCLQQKYEKLFKLFAACHKLYSHARPMKEEEIRELGRSNSQPYFLHSLSSLFYFSAYINVIL